MSRKNDDPWSGYQGGQFFENGRIESCSIDTWSVQFHGLEICGNGEPCKNTCKFALASEIKATNLLLASGCSLTADSYLGLKLLQLFGIHVALLVRRSEAIEPRQNHTRSGC